MNEKLAEALGYVKLEYISAAARKKRRKKICLSAIAALLAVALLTHIPAIPFVISAQAVSLASGSRMPDREDDFWAYIDARDQYDATATQALTELNGFFRDASVQFLGGSAENQVWSPVNAAIALAILAETADGSTRQELLDMLGAGDIETLRSYISAIWEASNKQADQEICTLANSLWLDDDMDYDQAVMDILAQEYYTSVYQGDLGSSRTNRAIQTWVNNNTGGLLKQMSNGIDVSPTAPAIDTALALASTIYFQAKWSDEFNALHNTTGVFHGPEGDTRAEYMNVELEQMYYYWGDSYGAVRKSLKNGTVMWLILPDADKSIDDVLSEGEYLTMMANSSGYEKSKYMKVNLSVPKFDISASLDLKAGLQEMGITEVFDQNGGNFGSTFETDLPIFVSRVNQATRVTVDEEGVTAATYILMDWGAGSAEPPEEIIDFVLDRPFVFVISTYGGIPLFAGTVNEP